MLPRIQTQILMLMHQMFAPLTRPIICVLVFSSPTLIWIINIFWHASSLSIIHFFMLFHLSLRKKDTDTPPCAGSEEVEVQPYSFKQKPSMLSSQSLTNTVRRCLSILYINFFLKLDCSKLYWWLVVKNSKRSIAWARR